MIEHVCGDFLQLSNEELIQRAGGGKFGLVFGSPPYESQRRYGALNFNLKGQAWVDWMVACIEKSLSLTDGLVAFVVEGHTKTYKWSATPALLMADLHRKGIKLRKPIAFHRKGICGSGGPDWLRNDWEFIVCCSHGRLPFSDNTAMGAPCKYPPGGAMSHRTKTDARVGKMQAAATEPKAIRLLNGELPPGSKLHTKSDGKKMRVQTYVPPKIANPGNVLKYSVGGGRQGHKLAHDNEASFPEGLAEFFVKSFCRPGDWVLDPFAGSFTTCAASEKAGRHSLGIDIRQDQVDLGRRRCADAHWPEEPGVATCQPV